MAFLPGLFGGDNVVGFFGGGRYRPNQQNFGIPDDQAGAMNFRMAEGGSGAAQDALGQYNPLAAAQSARDVLSQSLMAQLNGTAPSVAQQQLNHATQNNIANAYALSQTGGANPMAAKMAVDRAGAINQDAAGQAALLRAQEIQNAQGQLGALRGQDMGLYGLLNQTAQGYLGQQMGLQGMQQQGRQAYEAMNAKGFGDAQENAFGGKLFSAAAGAIAGAFGGPGAGAGAAQGARGGAPSVGGVNPMTTMVPPNTYQFASGGMAPGVMGDRLCPGCGNLNSECSCYGRAQGGLIPGYAPGGAVDSTSNDVVPALLSPGEVVLPRSVTMADDAATLAAEFVREIKAKQKGKMGKAA